MAASAFSFGFGSASPAETKDEGEPSAKRAHLARAPGLCVAAELPLSELKPRLQKTFVETMTYGSAQLKAYNERAVEICMQEVGNTALIEHAEGKQEKGRKGEAQQHSIPPLRFPPSALCCVTNCRNRKVWIATALLRLQKLATPISFQVKLTQNPPSFLPSTHPVSPALHCLPMFLFVVL